MAERASRGERSARGVCSRRLTWPAALAFVMASSAAASAQPVARFSLESVVEADEFGGESVSSRSQVVIDVSLAVRMGDNWQLYVRPWFRLPRPNSPTAPVPAWDEELYQAGVRYERRGPVAVRVDAGFILSPIGLGLYDVRPGQNPTIVPHLSYLTPMPVFDPTVPRVSPVAATYPLGAELSVSTVRWDARAAVVNSAPTRIYALGGTANPRQTPVVVAGGGVTPVTGLRIGASFAHGLYATPEEISQPLSRGRAMTMAGGEGEWAFSGTKISAEALRTAFESLGGTSVAYEWFVQGQQTLSPRWFLAARREGTSAPPLVNGIVVGQRTDLAVLEATAGYRVTRDVTLRGSYYARRLYGAIDWTNQAGVSVVWASRWW
ncbi:MAG: hypothetical protein ACRD2I_15620 [Vicinamibacterales bacterium]